MKAMSSEMSKFVFTSFHVLVFPYISARNTLLSTKGGFSQTEFSGSVVSHSSRIESLLNIFSSVDVLESGNYYRCRLMSCFHGSTSHVNNATSQFLKNAKVKVSIFIIVCFSSKEEEKEPKRRSSYAAARETMPAHEAMTAIHQRFWLMLSRK